MPERESASQSELQRRRFLGNLATGGVLGVVAVATPGCGGTLSSVPRRDGAEPDEVSTFLRRYASALGGGKQSPVSDALMRSGATPRAAGVRFAAHADPIAWRAIRSLAVAGAYGDLSEATRKDPTVVERLAAFSPEMDRSVIELRSLMASMPKHERARVGRALHKGNYTMAIAESLDREAASRDVSLQSRVKLRVAAQSVNLRLSRQPVSLFMDEYVTKIDRVAASRGIDIRTQSEAAAEGAEEMFWQAQEQGARVNTSASALISLASEEVSMAEPGGTPGRALLLSGSAALGIGGAALGIGGVALAGGEFTGAFLITVGALGAIGGLTLLIVGAAIRSRED
jgi:hypothetical protein